VRAGIRRPVRRLVAASVAALAVVLGSASAAGTVVDTDAAGTVRPGWAPGPDGLDSQHNETLVRDVT
jgi:hypothetical protein